MRTKTTWTLWLWLSSLSLLPVSRSRVWHRAVTVVVDPGRVDCYFIPNVTSTQIISLNFQVLGGKGRKND